MTAVAGSDTKGGMRTALTIAVSATLLLSACAGGKRGLHNFETGTGPDEFSVIPARPLSLPDDLNALPSPTPGGANLTDPNPNADAVVALGGRPSAANAGGIPARDSALVAHVGRNGVSPTIRAELAEADAQFRQRRSRGGLFSGGNRYFAAYANQALDAYAELIRFRNLGVAVPSAPPSE